MEYYKQVFDRTGGAPQTWTHQEFEECTFKKLTLINMDFTSSSFVNCQFEGCDLTRAILNDTKLYDVNFSICTLHHVDFGSCNPFGFHVNFQESQLNHAVFTNRKLKKARFIDCSLKEVFFLNCELTGTLFKDCDLDLTRFEGNDLRQADFSSSFNLTLDPETNKLKKAKFSLYNLPGLLSKYDLVIRE